MSPDRQEQAQNEEQKPGPSSLRHHEDGSVTIEGEQVDDPETYKGERIEDSEE